MLVGKKYLGMIKVPGQDKTSVENKNIWGG